MSDLRQAAQAALDQLQLNVRNLNQTMSKSMQRLQARMNEEAVTNLRAALAAPTKQKRMTNGDILAELTALDCKTVRLPEGWRQFARAIETECANRWGVEIEDEQD